MTSETIPFLDYKDIQKADRGEQTFNHKETGSTFTCRGRQYFHLLRQAVLSPMKRQAVLSTVTLLSPGKEVALLSPMKKEHYFHQGRARPVSSPIKTGHYQHFSPLKWQGITVFSQEETGHYLHPWRNRPIFSLMKMTIIFIHEETGGYFQVKRVKAVGMSASCTP